MTTETVGSWRELDEAMGESDWPGHRDRVRSPVVWRGLARSSYTNRSSLARLGPDSPRLERHLIRNFRKYAHREQPGPTMWDWLSLAQHHGLPTRLLDWTFSPLIALHFATAAWPEDEAILWAVDCHGAHEQLPATLHDALEREGSLVFTTDMLAEHAPDLDTLDGLTEDEPFVVFFEPPSLDERIINQAAVLSAFSDAECQMESWLDDNPELWRAWRIPPELKEEARERLDQAQINERLLLPGLDGIADWLRRYYTPRGAMAEQGGATMG